MKHPIREARDRALLQTVQQTIEDLLSVAKTDNHYLLLRGQLVATQVHAHLRAQPKPNLMARALWRLRRLSFKLAYRVTRSQDPDVIFDPHNDPRVWLRLYWRLCPSKRPRNLVENPSMERSVGWGTSPTAVGKAMGDSVSKTTEIPSTQWHKVAISAYLKVEGENRPSQQELVAMLFDPRTKAMLGIQEVERDVPFYIDSTSVFVDQPGRAYFDGSSDGGSIWSSVS